MRPDCAMWKNSALADGSHPYESVTRYGSPSCTMAIVAYFPPRRIRAMASGSVSSRSARLRWYVRVIGGPSRWGRVAAVGLTIQWGAAAVKHRTGQGKEASWRYPSLP